MTSYVISRGENPVKVVRGDESMLSDILETLTFISEDFNGKAVDESEALQMEEYLRNRWYNTYGQSLN